MFTLETLALDAGPTVVIAKPEGYIPIAAAAAELGLAIPDRSLFDLLDGWDELWPKIVRIAAEAPIDPSAQNARRLLQHGRTRKVLCAGANYWKHLAEMKVTYEKDAAKAPFIFLKPPTAVVGPGRTVPVDRAITMLDWEVELTAIIGRRGRDIPVERALEHVAGYTVAIDLTARDRHMQPETIFKFDWLAGKGQDGFCPTASGMLPAAFLPDPQRTRIRLAVNGTTKQDASTDDMIYSVAELVSWASKLSTLEPGDLLLTGSPEGVGFPRKEFLAIGDRVTAEVDGLAPLEIELFAKE